MRVESVIASSWSWVTTMKVTPERLLDLDQLELGLLAQLLVERAERLVEQQELRPLDQAPRQRHPLPLAARELVRLARRRSGSSCTSFSISATRSRASLAPHAVAQQPVGDVLLHRHVREERVGLEHHVGRPLVGRHARSCPARRSRSARRSASRSRRASAAASTCRSPSRRAGRTARPCRCRG